MSQSTITVSQVITYASQHTELMPLVGVGGTSNEPALSIANDVMSELLAQPHPWKFNRTIMPIFVTQQWKQDYKFAGATAFTQNGGAAIALATAGTPGITEVSTTATVTTIEPHNFNVGDTVYITGATVAGYNSTFTQTPSGSAWSNGYTILTVPTTTSFTITATGSLGTSGAPGITDLGWLEYATMVNMNDTSASQYVWYLQAVRNLEPANRQYIPDRIAVFADDGAGTLTLRLRYLPGPQPMGVTIAYQKRPTLITATSTTWAPFPDEYAYVYRQMFLAHAFRFANSGRADVEYEKAMANVAKALGADDREQSEEYISPEGSLGGTFSWGGWWW